MRHLLEHFMEWWDARTFARPPIGRYEVTPRQGRYTVRRKLLRRLQHRLKFTAWW